MELVRRSLGCGLRARIIRHPIQLTVLRTTNYCMLKHIYPTSTFLNQSRHMNAPAKPMANPSEVPKLHRQLNELLDSNTTASQQADVGTRVSPKVLIAYLERAFNRFETKCQRSEHVHEKDLVKVFDSLTKVVERLEEAGELNDDNKVNISMLLAILIRCCGKLMNDSPVKTREMLAGNIWHFIKEKKIPVDISHYNSLIRVLNENNTTYDPQKMLDEITAAHMVPDRVTYQRLIHQYCLQGDINGATKLLEKMKDLGMELNELTFASLIIGYGKQDSPPSTTEIFDLMKSNGVEPGSSACAAAIVSQANLLSKNPVAEDELKSLLELVVREEFQFHIYDLVDIFNALNPHKKNETVAKILHEITKGSIYFGSNYCNRLFSVMMKNGEHEAASRIYWSQRPSRRAMRIGNMGVYYIKLLAAHKNVPVDHVIEECSKLKANDFNNRAFYHLYHAAAESGNLNVVRAAIEKIGEEEKIKCHYYWPLLAQAKNDQEIINALKNDLNPKMDSTDLLDTFVQWVWPRFFENIPKLFEANKELHYDNNILITSFFNYSVQENKTMEAIKFITEAPEVLVDEASKDAASKDEDREVVDDDNSRRPSNERSVLLGRLLNQIAEHTKDPVLVNKALSLCALPGQQFSAKSLLALVKVHLLNDDFKSALDAYLDLAEKYRVTVCKRDLMAHCLKNKDTNNLQKIMDASTAIHGEQNSLFDLAVCCLQNDKLKQAQKIFASPGFKVMPNRVYLVCKSLAQAGDVDALENFVHLARDMYDVNQEYLYQSLIGLYERTSNGRRALDLWNRMQEEEFQPSKRNLAMIAKVLESNNIEVPFQKPRVNPRE